MRILGDKATATYPGVSSVRISASGCEVNIKLVGDPAAKLGTVKVEVVRSARSTKVVSGRSGSEVVVTAGGTAVTGIQLVTGSQIAGDVHQVMGDRASTAAESVPAPAAEGAADLQAVSGAKTTVTITVPVGFPYQMV